ncbi:MAG: DUF2490 domain-containing protein [Candidatus Omnitrophica bacterium]|nr:DUF2490 domain-containing protein [Candidatus Omnitrophota bacterium]
MKKVITILILCAYLVSVLAASAFAIAKQANGDWQIWTVQKAEVKVGKDKKFKIKAEQEERFGNDIRAIYYTHTDLGVDYKFTGWFSMGLNYRYVVEKISGKWKEESRPYITATLSREIFGLKFSDRSMLEYRIRKYSRGTVRYRNKLTMVIPLEWTRLDISPYAADEIFIDNQRQRLNKNRIYGGFKFKVIKHLGGEIFYMTQASESKGKWPTFNVIGLQVKAAF